MDSLIVDLDKVLDDFEAEEKAAGRTPGQEPVPSGFAQYIQSTEEKPWLSLSESPVSNTAPLLERSLITNKLNTVNTTYDDPYVPSITSENGSLDNLKKDVEYSGDFNYNDIPYKSPNIYDLKYPTQESEGPVFNTVESHITEKERVKPAPLNLPTESHLISHIESAVSPISDKFLQQLNHSGIGYVNGINDTPKQNDEEINSDAKFSVTDRDSSDITLIKQVDVSLSNGTPLSDTTDSGIFTQPSLADETASQRSPSHHVGVPSNVSSTPVVDSSGIVQKMDSVSDRIPSGCDSSTSTNFTPPHEDAVITDHPRLINSNNQVSDVNTSQTIEPCSVTAVADKLLSSEYVQSTQMSGLPSQINQPGYETSSSANSVSSIDRRLEEGIGFHSTDNSDRLVQPGQFREMSDKGFPSVIVSDPHLHPGHSKVASAVGFPAAVPGDVPLQPDQSASSMVGFQSTDINVSDTELDNYLSGMDTASSVTDSNQAPKANHLPMEVSQGNECAISHKNPIIDDDKKCDNIALTITSAVTPASCDQTIMEQVTPEKGPSVNTQSSFPSLSPSTESTSPTSVMLGQGARPKDFSQMKKSRPNSLLGLSKVTLESPVEGVHSPERVPDRECDIPSSDSVLISDMCSHPSMINNCISHDVHPSPQKVLISEVLGNSNDSGIIPEHERRMNIENERRSKLVSMENETPVLRHKSPKLPEPMQANLRVTDQHSRPHSWGPTGDVQSGVPKQKRPTSLNLPPRQDLHVQRDKMSPSETLPEESIDADASEPCLATDVDTGDSTPAESISEEVGAASGTPDASIDMAPAVEAVDLQPPITSELGSIPPVWIPDSDAANCMKCVAKFTFTKRRHHCRACGKIFCSTCCSIKCKLPYMENKEARVCQSCHDTLQEADLARRARTAARIPHPNNPSDYCSTIPPTQQVNACTGSPPTVLVPVGVLKRDGTTKKSEPKQVMFSDGIRPGGDLTELDGSSQNRVVPRRSGRSHKKVEKDQDGSTKRVRSGENWIAWKNQCLIPEEGLPPIVSQSADNPGDLSFVESCNMDEVITKIKGEDNEPVVFAVNSSLFVLVKILNLDCCVNKICWCFSTKGMCTVGQHEIVILLECLEKEETIPRDIFLHFQTVYEEAGKGNTVSDMGHSIFNQSFLDSRDHGGFLYIRPTFQCLQKLIIPSPPYLFGILLQKWETPWSKVFPLRLLLRLGAEYRYYPCPLISVRNRKPVFFEIGHTIMNLLADFRNYQYMLPQIRGVSIHLEDKQTYISFPKNRYDELMKVVCNSNEHVMALGASFSSEADSHLVCIQNDDGNYQTQAINIQNKARKVTGASFVVFNGALKSSSGLTAKSSIVEDGLMVQIMAESMAALKQAMKDMKDYKINCGSITAEKPEEVVNVLWVDDDKNINIGVKSPVDKMSMDGIESIHIHNSTDYVGECNVIRWTEVFFIQNDDSGLSRWEPVDLSRLAETLSSACCIALTPHLEKLKEAAMTKIGLRVTLDADKVGYDIGSGGEKLPDFYMNELDNELIPVIHGAASQTQGGAVILELIFHVLY